MAKKPKKEAAKDGAAEDGSTKVSAPKSKKKLLLIAGAVVVLLGGGGGGYLMLKKPHTAGEAHAEEKKAVAFVDIREMTVNLAPEPSQDHQRFLKFRVALEVSQEMGYIDSVSVVARLRRRMVERVLTHCETDRKAAEPLLILLRRFATESAREEARMFCEELVADEAYVPPVRDLIAA